MGHFKDLHSSSGERLLASDLDVHDGSVGDGPFVYLRERRSRWSGFASFFTSFTLGVLTATIVFGAGFAIGRRNDRLRAKDRATYSFASTDALPTVPYETVTFEAEPIYSAKSSDDSDYAWNMLLPPGRGYVFVPDAEERGLAPGQQTFEGDIWSVAMYHQLHCLARVRKMYWIFEDAITTGEDSIARAHTGRTAAAHIQHCFDYLRQALQCNGDMTLEWPKQDGPSSRAVVDGWGVPHTCKSPTAIKDYMDKYHFNSSMVFDAAG